MRAQSYILLSSLPSAFHSLKRNVEKWYSLWISLTVRVKNPPILRSTIFKKDDTRTGKEIAGSNKKTAV